MTSGGKLSVSSQRLQIDGHTFWRAKRGGQATELTTATGIELDADGCRWIVSVPGAAAGEPVESGSRDVVRFMGGVLAEMQRAAHRAMVRRPVPKPSPKPAAPVPANAPVPCPLCRGDSVPESSGSQFGAFGWGEPWPDCEVCDGTGYVTQRRAAEWREAHGS